MNKTVWFAIMGLALVAYVLLIESTREYAPMTVHGECVVEELGAGEAMLLCKRPEIIRHVQLVELN